jgi:hypothetical protein
MTTTHNQPDPPDPAAVLGALSMLLEARGQRHLYGAADARTGVAVLSVRDGTTVWIDTRARLLRWLENGLPVQWPLADLEGAARRLAVPPRTRRTADQPRLRRPANIRKLPKEKGTLA